MLSSDLEYKTAYFVIIGLIGLFVWSLSFWRVFKAAQIYLPGGNQNYILKTLRLILFLIGVIAWLYISYSLMGPRKPLGQAKNPIEVNDIFIVVDTSLSMSGVDLRPNRMEASKEKILQFIRLHPNDRIGIIIFSEKAFTLLPLTTDMKLIEQIVPRIKMGPLGGGTNIGDALALAVARGSQSLAKNKVILLLTDGVNNVGNITPLQAAEEAHNYKIKIYTIGLGTDGGMMPQGGGLVAIPGGSVDMKTLQQISEMTGGKSFRAADSKNLENVLNEIEKLEKTKIEIGGRIIYEELYWKYLILGVCLLFGVEIFRRVIIKEGQ